jgi:hypothetical protein
MAAINRPGAPAPVRGTGFNDVMAVLPRDVPGFTGHNVPPAAPALLPGESAQAEFRRFLLKSVAVVVAVLLIFDTAPDVGLGSAGTIVVALAAGLLALWLILQLFAPVGDRTVEELEHGYTTLTLRRPALGRAAWDYSGAWVLDGRTGAVRSAPDPEQEPPGFYPSPNRPGALELWTGAEWAGRYRDA